MPMDSSPNSTTDSVAFDAMLNGEHPIKLDAAKWAREHLNDPELAQRDVDCTFWQDGWDRLVERGVLGLIADPTYGGRGLPLTSALLELEGLGLGCRDDGLIFAATSTILTTLLTVERFCSDEQKSEWLPQLVSGKAFGAFSMTELESGSDAFALETTATKPTTATCSTAPRRGSPWPLWLTYSSSSQRQTLMLDAGVSPRFLFPPKPPGWP